MLSILARLCYDAKTFASIKNKSLFDEFNAIVKEIVLCLKPTSSKLINFIIKDMIRKYGSSSLKYVQSNSLINWMTPQDIIGDDKNIVDKYVLGGRNYNTCKEAILYCFREKTHNALDEKLHEKADELLPYLCVSFYQNITLLYRNVDNLTTKIAEIFDPVLVKYYANEQRLVSPLLGNSFEHNLRVSEQTWPSVDLGLLLVQIKFCLVYSKSNLIKPLRDLILTPNVFEGRYFPTMPQDNLFDVKIALAPTGIEATKFYACPNGHIYVIGNCGRPWVKDRCKECGEEIGGEGHKVRMFFDLCDFKR